MSGDDKTFAQAAVGHYAQDFQICAAIACVFSAGVAVAAVHVWLDGAAIAGFDVRDICADGDDFNS